MEKYNIYIVEDSTDKAHSLIGKDLSERMAERRVMTGISRINENFSVFDVEVGSKEDKKYSMDLQD